MFFKRRKKSLTGFVTRLATIGSRWRVETIFIVAASIVGVSFAVITPPFQGWDETEHFYRAYQVSELNMRAEKLTAVNVSQIPGSEGPGGGGQIPKNIVDAVHDLRFNHDEKGRYLYSDITRPGNNSTDYAQKVPTRFDNTSIYSAAGYIPQAITIAVTRFIETSPMVMFYAARIAGLLVWLGLMYLAIRLLPSGKKLFLLLALNPVAIFVAVTMSPDAYAAAFIALAVALGMRLRRDEPSLGQAWPVVLAFIAVIGFAVMIKNVYLPVALLILLLPKSVLSLTYKLVIAGVIIAVSLAWNLSIAHLTASIPSYFTITDHINAKDQIMFILEHPLKFMGILLWNIFGTNSILFNFTYNGTLVETKLPPWTILAWGAAFTYVALLKVKESGKYVYDAISMWLPALAAVGITVLIIASMYVGWTPVGGTEILGVQGRYFIPVSFLLVPLLLHARLRLITSSQAGRAVVFCLIAAALVAVLVSFALRYTVVGLPNV